MLEVKNLLFRYEGENFLYDFNAKTKEITSIKGKSGSGKSTLLSLLAGFLNPHNGDILLFGKSILHLKPFERDLSILFQNNNLFEHLSLYENIALGINSKLKISKTQKDQLYDLAKKFQIDNLLNRLPNQISGGQRQRAALCRTLLRKRKVLLLDEPFSALDEDLKNELLELILKITKEQQLCTIMVTHSNEDALRYSSKIATIENGKIVRFDENLAVF